MTNPMEEYGDARNKNNNKIRKKGYKSQLSLYDIQRSALSCKGNNNPKKDKLKRSLCTDCNMSRNFDNNITELSMISCKTVFPYIKLSSLSDLSNIVNSTKLGPRTFVYEGRVISFDPTKLVKIIDEELNKIIITSLSKYGNYYKKQGTSFIAKSDYRKGHRESKILAKKDFTFSPSKKKKGRLSGKEIFQEMWKPKTKLDASLDAPSQTVEICDEFEAKINATKEKLVSALDVLSNNRPKTVAFKKRNLIISENSRDYATGLGNMRMNAEKDKIIEYQELIKKYATKYYKMMEFILFKGYERENSAHFIMNYYKAIIENGEAFKKEHLNKLKVELLESKKDEKIKEYI